MKAMILAAGLGTRLRPLTDDRPKALVEIDGRTLLEITLTRLQSFGIRDVIVNVHHFADKVVDYLKMNGNFGMLVEVSREDVLLDTGGGLKKAAHFFLRDSAESKTSSPESDEPILIHNVDVLSTIDFTGMAKAHAASGALATLAVRDRHTSRYLLFDQDLQLCGRRAGLDGPVEMVRPSREVHAMAFSGIHIVSARLLPKLTEDGEFSIITSYLRLAAKGEQIAAFRDDEYYWRDLGRPDDLKQAAQDLKNM